MITITKNKIYHSPYSLKSTNYDSDEVKEITISNVIFFLGEDVEFGEDLTFKQLFEIIIYHKNFFNIIFNFNMNGIKIDDFIEDFEKDILPKSTNQDYKVMFSWLCEIYDFEDKIEYYDGVAFEGFGKLDSKDNKEYLIGLSFTSLSEYKNKLVFSDNTFEIHNKNSYKNEIEADFKANYRPFTLYDIIDGILREISYYGNPKQRKETMKEIEINQKEIKKMIEEDLINEHIEDNEYIFDELKKDEFEEILKKTFWEVIYPKKNEKKLSKEKFEFSKIELSDIGGVTLEEQLQDALDKEDYRKAAKINKLIKNKRNKK